MNIKVYIRTTEPWSQTLLRYLNARHLPYTRVEVSVDRDGFQEMVTRSGQKRVPVIDIDGCIIVGFKLKEIEDALAKKQPGADPMPE